MEIIVIFIIYIVVKLMINSARNESIKKEVNSKLEEGLKLNITRKKDKLEGINDEIEILDVKIKGVIYSNLDDKKIGYYLTITDVTDEPMPIFSVLESMQLFDGIFGIRSDLFRMPYEISEFHAWTGLYAIPLDILVFPKKGKRKLKVELSVVNSLNKVVNQSHQIISFENDKVGYEDAAEYAKKIKKHSINMAMYAASIDGEITKEEADIIKGWIISNFKASELENNNIHDIISESLEEIKKMSKESYIKNIYNEINSIATNRDKHDMLELVLSVTAGDSKFDKDEENLLEDICNNLEINRKIYNKMTSKIVSVNIREDLNNVNKMFGIHDDMSYEEKNKILKREYRKWNSRVNHSDKKMRDQAENMLKLIAEEKKKIRKYK